MTPLNRREFLAAASAAALSPLSSAFAAHAPPAAPMKTVGAATTIYHHNSHADVILTRMLRTHSLDDKGRRPSLKLGSVYIEQIHEKDIGRDLAKAGGVRLSETIADALTLGGNALAVDGVLLVGEHGKYPMSDKGQTLYPRRRFFEETVKVFEKSGRVVPVFSDKHLSAGWDDAKWMYDAAVRMKIPFMAGSSLPTTWRKPEIELARGAKPSEMLVISYHTLDSYGFHALEALQCLAERRGNGETGVAAVQCIEGADVWKAGEDGRFDRKLLNAALDGCENKRRYKGRIEDAVKLPSVCLIEYRDGLKAAMVTLNIAVDEFVVAWREPGKAEPAATVFWLQEARPFGHFGMLLDGIAKMVETGKPTWPVERTLLTTGVLDALHTSRHKGGARIETPHLAISYAAGPAWTPPPLPVPSRPIHGP